MFPPFLFSLQLADVRAAFVMMLFRIGGRFLALVYHQRSARKLCGWWPSLSQSTGGKKHRWVIRPGDVARLRESTKFYGTRRRH